MTKVASSVALITALFIGTSCRSASDQERVAEKGHSPEVTKSSRSVEPMDQAGLKRLIGQRNGKILVLNIWATWCAPCVAEFPDLIKLSQSYDTTAVEVVAISADYPDEVETKILPFLRKMNVPFRVYVAQFERQDDFINTVNRSWSGALPASLIFDSSGKVRFFHVGQRSFGDFKHEIDKIEGSP